MKSIIISPTVITLNVLVKLNNFRICDTTAEVPTTRAVINTHLTIPLYSIILYTDFDLIIIMSGKILMMLFLVLLSVGFVVADDVSVSATVCLEPADDTDIETSVVLCGGTYYVNDTNGDGVLRIVSDNVVVDFNGSTLIGNGEGKGIIIEGRNVTIKNGKVKDYWLGADIAGNYTKLRDFEVEGGDFGVVVETAFGVDVRNVYCHGVNDACLHDFDQSLEGLYVYNLTCDCICNWCAYLPHSVNVTITDSNLRGSGVNANDVTDFKVLNTVVNVTDSGGILSEMGGSDFQINNSNIIVNTNQPAISFANGQYSNIIIYNTDLSGNGESMGIGFESCSNNCVIEGVTVSNFNNGVFSNTSAGISILDSEFTSISDIGIHLGDDMSDITVSNVTVVSGGTPFECVHCDNVLIEDSFFNGTGGFVGIGLWDGSGATVTRNEVYTVAYVGLMIGTNNTVVSFNNVSGERSIYLYYNRNTTIYNNTFEGVYGLNCEDASDAEIYNNTFDVNWAQMLLKTCRNFVACDNDVTYTNGSLYLYFMEGYEPVLVNYMRVESSSCTPYLSATFNYNSVDYGNVDVGDNTTCYGNVTVSSNMVNATFIATGTSNFVSPYGQFSISQLYFMPDSSGEYPSSEVQLQLNQGVASFDFLYNELNNFVQNAWRLLVPSVHSGTYTANVTVTVVAG